MVGWGEPYLGFSTNVWLGSSQVSGWATFRDVHRVKDLQSTTFSPFRFPSSLTSLLVWAAEKHPHKNVLPLCFADKQVSSSNNVESQDLPSLPFLNDRGHWAILWSAPQYILLSEVWRQFVGVLISPLGQTHGSDKHLADADGSAFC